LLSTLWHPISMLPTDKTYALSRKGPGFLLGIAFSHIDLPPLAEQLILTYTGISHMAGHQVSAGIPHLAVVHTMVSYWLEIITVEDTTVKRHFAALAVTGRAEGPA